MPLCLASRLDWSGAARRTMPARLRSRPSGRGFDRHLCQTEIENLGMAALSNENVGWLNVSVNDALAMRRIERVGDLRAQVQNQFGFQRLAHDAVLQGHAIRSAIHRVGTER